MKSACLGLTHLDEHSDHIPLIQVRYLPQSHESLAKIDQGLLKAQLWIITSKTTVRWLKRFQSKLKALEDISSYQFLAVGTATAKALKESFNIESVVPDEHTQEGIIGWLQKNRGLSIAWLRSDKARNKLEKYLYKTFKSVQIFDVYTVEPKILKDPEVLTEYDHLIFTSPSSVESFLIQAPNTSKSWSCKAIGPITKESLLKAVNDGQAKLILTD